MTSLGKYQKSTRCSARRVTVAALLVVFLSGCMTITTREDTDDAWPRVYSGTLMDLAVIGMPVLVATGEVDPGGLMALQFLWIAVLDLPFSFVADTLLLPITIPEQIALNRKPEEEALSADLDTDRWEWVRVGEATIRDGPGSDFDAIGTVKAPALVEILEERNGWERVVVPSLDDREGWIDGARTSSRNPAETEGTGSP